VAGAIGQPVVAIEPPNGTLDQTVQVSDANLGKVDNENFRYYLVARLTGAGAGDAVALSTFQIVYIGSR
jgi:hypothetical protein